MYANGTRWKAALLILWGAITGSVIIYVLIACAISRSGVRLRLSGSTLGGLADPLSFLIPVGAMFLGIAAYRAVARSGPARTPRPADSELPPDLLRRQIQIGAIVMLSVFEVTSVAGLFFYFLGASLGMFLRFAIANLVLDVVGLRLILQDIALAESIEKRGQSSSG